MKKLCLAFMAIAWAGTAFAGSYHRGQQLVCSECHAMHASRSHNFGTLGGAADSNLVIGKDADATGVEYLLANKTVNATCLACHDGQAGIPDVEGLNTNANQRPAGFLYEIADSDNTEADAVKGHTMGSKVTPPGFTGTWDTATEFECSDCHGVHGTAAYRNLVNQYGRLNSTQTGFSGSTFGFAPTYSIVTGVGPAAGSGDAAQMFSPAAGLAVFNTDVVVIQSSSTIGWDKGDNYNTNQIAYTVAASDPSLGTMTRSWDTVNHIYTSYTAFATPADATQQGRSKMNQYCGTCHGNFHGSANTAVPTGTPGKFKRHPTSGVTFATSKLVDTGDKLAIKPVWASTTSFEPGCLSCHKAHGTANNYGLVIPAEKVGLTARWGKLDTNLESGDAAGTGTIRNLCYTCHGQGRL